MADQLRGADSPAAKKPRANATTTTKQPDVEAAVVEIRNQMNALPKGYRDLIIKACKAEGLPPIGAAAIAKNGYPTYGQCVKIAGHVSFYTPFDLPEDSDGQGTTTGDGVGLGEVPKPLPVVDVTAADTLPTDLAAALEYLSTVDKFAPSQLATAAVEVHKRRVRDVVMACSDADIDNDGRHKLCGGSSKTLTYYEAKQVERMASEIVVGVRTLADDTRPVVQIDWRALGRGAHLKAVEMKTMANQLRGEGEGPVKTMADIDYTAPTTSAFVSAVLILDQAQATQATENKQAEPVPSDQKPVQTGATVSLGDALVLWARKNKAAFDELVALLNEHQSR